MESKVEKTIQKVEQESQESRPEPIPKPEADEDKQKEEGNKQAEEILKKTQYVEAERLAALKSEMLEVEQRIDKKLKDFKKFVEDTEVQGRSLAAPEKSAEEKATEEANKLLKGTGLSI